MQLSDIEKFVLINVGYTRYSTLSVATDADQQEDFSLLHRCVFMARELINTDCPIPEMIATQSITVSANVNNYILNADFGQVIVVKYNDGTDEWLLSRAYPESLLQKLGSSKTTDTGTPSWYLLIGNSSDNAVIEVYLVPAIGATMTVIYKKVLANLTSPTNEDVIMKKYPMAVIYLASAYMYQLIKKDMNQFNAWLTLGLAEIGKIKNKELTADSNFMELPDALTRVRRSSRFTQ